MRPEFKIFSRIIKAINSPSKGIDEVLHIIMVNISELIQAEAWSLFILDEEKRELVFHEVFGEKAEKLKGMRIPMDKGIVGWVATNKKPVIVDDVYKDKRFFKEVDKKSRFKTKSILAVPMISRGKLVGVVEVINKKDGKPFTKGDLEIIKTYVEQAALALENANLLKNLKQKIDYLTLLSRINRNITSILDFKLLLNRSAEIIRKTFGYHYVCIGLKRGKKVILQGFSTAEGLPPRRTVIYEGEGIVGEAIRLKKPVVVKDVSKETRYLPGIEGTLSEMVIPIKKKGQLLGIIDIGNNYSDSFKSEEIEVITQVSHQLAVAIENAKLYEKIKESTLKDDLTGFYNSRYTEGPLKDLVNEAVKEGHPVSLIFLDLDHFKWVNDSFDHLVGSYTLRLVANRLKRYIKDVGIGIRYGGDEYMIILPGMNLKEAVEFAEFLRKKLNGRRFKISKNTRYRISASFGVSSMPEVAGSVEELIRTADIAMYKVKELGRNNTAYFDKERRIKLVNDWKDRI
ncbi:MAG TPA: sensor domain-containing diguanylate cyclase [candidate division WOR-3 bacterium]|uniref:Sensor domain-containing diguanylate cyclase n=1 Tax=candidate division WOR-3 bacterium TaxID=2052148 RepID=A0A7C0VBT4_UNCW3|nr:sensor domain-containing diguanylate cyclase [candidate division WOR-3 bacterium]